MKISKEPIKIVNNAISKLSEVQQDVLIKRYGLDGGKTWTLESIGRSYAKSITRERVRQRESNALNCLRENSLKSFGPIFNGFFEVFKNNGGAVKTDLFLDEMIKYFELKKNADLNKKTFLLLLKLNNYFKEVKETEKFHNGWTTDIALIEGIKLFIANLVKAVGSKKDIIDEKELLNLSQNVLAKIDLLKKYAKSNEVIFSYINISKEVQQNVFGDWGLKYWAEISPKGVRDRAYLVLRKNTTSLHFNEITKLINKNNFSQKTACPQTVHNELIKDGKFILVGKGIYGLKEWGFIPGTVRDLLRQILQNLNTPISPTKLVEEVLKQRQVKATTVLLNLHDKKYFKKLDDGRYFLK